MEPLDPLLPGGSAPPPPTTLDDPPLSDGPGDPTVGAGIADTRALRTSNAAIVAAEFVGTAVLIMLGPGSAILAASEIGILGVSLAFGFALLLLAYVIGPISGCHINPAVTLGMLLSKKITPRHAAYAWAAQVIGGIFGAVIIFGIASGREGWQPPTAGIATVSAVSAP